ncbi:hypothetical protein Enr13x_27490 [Stieleria neptunia]|uniref:Uncharacterized protein n=1 Tax=Stieleria neptunia TaxID=2527979 RepID=A0A518HPX5_9BACT|nr:hypothetical protein [Stieleria neptunia]QDV42898.1 hypothetical protein Enr13x_27490 [Stieleria neptunia]
MDADKLKDFAVYNFEKLIVAIVVLLSAFLVYSGLDKRIITEEQDPDRLAQNATEVKRQVDDDHTDAIVNDPENPREPKFDIAMEQKKFLQPIKSSLYQPDPWDLSKASKDKVRRKDPMIAKPAAVRTTGVIASLAYRSQDGTYALADLEPADELEVVEAKPKRSSRRNRRQNQMDMMMGGGEGDMDMMGMDMEMMGMDMMGMDMESSGAGTSGPIRKLAAEKNLGTTAKNTQNLKTGADQPPVPGIGLFIAGTAVIPHKQLIDAYQEALSYAVGYDPIKRDLPRYVAYQVQRADVTNKSVDQLTDADWILRDSNETTIGNAALYWSGFAPELVPEDYRIPGVTMWIPPVLLDPYASFANHPLIPLKTKRALLAEQMEKEAEAAKASAGPVDMEQFEIDIAGGQTRTFGGGMDEGYDMEMGMDMDMGMDEGYDMDMGMGSARSANEGKPAEENPVDYKLLRFYDFAYIQGKTYKVGGKVVGMDPRAPRMNRQYVYRVRFAVNDPNFPKSPELQPKSRNLDPEAYKRYVTLAAEAEQTQQRNYKRWSDWSDPSAPTSLPPVDRVAFGSVKPYKPRVVSAGNRRIEIESDPPKAEVVASSFDPRLGVFVPARMEATEGTVLSTEVESAEVVDPITLEVKKTDEPKIVKSSATVIDVEGGAPLEIVDDETIVEPGIFLMVDSNGKLRVRDATEEQRVYRIQSFAEERGL